MRTNRVETPRTAGGARASRIGPAEKLKRLVLTHLLWEKGFYIDGKTVTEQIQELVPQVDPQVCAEIAMDAHREQKLRHVPLFVVREMARHSSHRPMVAMTLEQVITRADSLAEFLSLYWGETDRRKSKEKLCHQVKKGLRNAFQKFNAFQLAKNDKNSAAISLRDVMFLVAPQAKDEEQAATFEKLASGTLEVPDTWETALSAGQGKDKLQDWTRLLVERKLGALAFLRNLRNMTEAGVNQQLIRESMANLKVEKVLPFQFLTAAKHAPAFRNELEALMLRCLEGVEKFDGHTYLVIDVSGSMGSTLSAESEMRRIDTAIALAMLIKEVCEKSTIYLTAGNDGTRIHKTQRIDNPQRGFALGGQIAQLAPQLGGGGIFLTQAMDHIVKAEGLKPELQQNPRRVIVITDEQDCDQKLSPDKANAFGVFNYILNIAPEKNGVAYNKFTHINGFSEHCISFIHELETFVNEVEEAPAPAQQLVVQD